MTSFGKFGKILFAVIFAAIVMVPSLASAQSVSPRAGNVTIRQYLAEAGGMAKLVRSGKIRLGGRMVRCGRRPVILDPEFDTWAGAYTNPGFIIVNPRYMKQESAVVQLYIFAHECGHQFRGFDEDTADAFAIRRGVRQGWIKGNAMNQICRFISRIPGDAEHPAGPLRCRRMRVVYRDIMARHLAHKRSLRHRHGRRVRAYSFSFAPRF